MRKGISAERTKIVCTLGPASADEQTISEMIRHGMAVARLNFSHGTLAFHRKLIRTVRKASRKLGVAVAILQDLSGPKIRVGLLRDTMVKLTAGQRVTISAKEMLGDENSFSATPPGFLSDLRKGDRLYIDDGLLRLIVQQSGNHEVVARVVQGGLLRQRKGINVPTATLALPSLTEKDLRDLAFGVENGVDLVALSFVRSAGDIIALRRQLKKHGVTLPVIAKLEKPQAIKNIHTILEEADGVMIARGDLGVEMPLEQLPIIQKQIIATARDYHKPVITATQMLESMTTNITPTRAEVTDVANAIFDGTDAVMLSAETASGAHPIAAVATMTRVIHASEAEMRRREAVFLPATTAHTAEIPVAVAQAAAEMARDIKARLIAVFSRSGLSARLISKQFTPVPIVAFTPVRRTQRLMMLYRGVQPQLLKRLESVDKMVSQVEDLLKAQRCVRTGDRIVIVASAPVKVQGETNLLKLHVIS